MSSFSMSIFGRRHLTLSAIYDHQLSVAPNDKTAATGHLLHTMTNCNASSQILSQFPFPWRKEISSIVLFTTRKDIETILSAIRHVCLPICQIRKQFPTKKVYSFVFLPSVTLLAQPMTNRGGYQAVPLIL